jgi:hypothetical protein
VKKIDEKRAFFRPKGPSPNLDFQFFAIEKKIGSSPIPSKNDQFLGIAKNRTKWMAFP